jgi:hypothetical protein
MELSRDIHEFIRACEVAQSRLALGPSLTEDESTIIEMCALDLLAKLAEHKTSRSS